jgi:nucleoid-associated protein YejK
MNQDTKIQIPINSKLKVALRKKSEAYGFSSVNEALRLLIQNFVKGNIVIQFIQPNQNQEIPYLDFETESRMTKNLKEICDGDYDLLDFEKNPNALKDLLK